MIDPNKIDENKAEILQNQRDALIRLAERIAELEGESKIQSESIYKLSDFWKQREQQIASDAWDAAVKWSCDMLYKPNKEQYLRQFTGDKQIGQRIFDTTDQVFKIWDGTKWVIEQEGTV